MTDANMPETKPITAETAPAAPTAPVQAAPATAETTSAAPAGGKLDSAITKFVRFLAKALGKPDPITGQPTVAATPTTQAAPKESLGTKVWSAANKVVGQATDVAAKAAETTKSTVNQAVEGVKDVQKDIAAQAPTTPAQETPAQPASIPGAPTQSLETLEENK